MAISAERYRQLVQQEYEWLRHRLGLAGIPVFFEARDDAWPRYGVPEPRSALGRLLRPAVRRTFFRTGILGLLGRKLYPRRIVIPYSDGDLSAMHECDIVPAREPPNWRRLTSPPCRAAYLYWDEWRTTLWHEVCHQIQDEKDFGWNPHDGHEAHGPSWSEAVAWMAGKLGAPPGDLGALIAPAARM